MLINYNTLCLMHEFDTRIRSSSKHQKLWEIWRQCSPLMFDLKSTKSLKNYLIVNHSISSCVHFVKTHSQRYCSLPHRTVKSKLQNINSWNIKQKKLKHCLLSSDSTSPCWKTFAWIISNHKISHYPIVGSSRQNDQL